jgi:penicillin amidase
MFRLNRRTQLVDLGACRVRMRRTVGGVVELWGQNDLEMARAMGFIHAHDRQTQMMLVRLVGQGRLCECLKDSPQMLAIDRFSREMAFVADAQADVARLDADARACVEAYTEGVNLYQKRHGRPWELAAVGHRPEPWSVSDTLLIIKVLSFIGLAQTQQDLEKLLIESIQRGVSTERLKRLFAPHLDGLDEETVRAIRQVRSFRPFLPPAQAAARLTGTLQTSNNWAVAGTRTKNGTPIECHDPHLEGNRLPAVWYEVILHTADDYRMGVNTPGVPGVIMGRNGNVSWGFTYGFMDMVDYFIEDVRGGRVRRADGWHEISGRRETLRRPQGDEQLTVRATDRGTLECDPLAPVEDGFYLCRAWSAAGGGAAESVNALWRLLPARTVSEAQEAVRRVTISCNWVLADRAGNIGCQQSGLLPERPHSGLFPLLGWKEGHCWRGLVDPARLHHSRNPPEGIVATANQRIDPAGGPLAVNLCAADYRVERIRELLEKLPSATAEDMKRIQLDVYSKQAERFMPLLRPHLPPGPAADLLRDWDLCYDEHSQAATLFEEIHEGLLSEVFGEPLFGEETWEFIRAQTNLLANYGGPFDDALVSDDPSWFAGTSREALYAAVAERVLSRRELPSILEWGRRRAMMMNHLLLGGRFPGFLKIDFGPLPVPGNPHTVRQGSVFRSHGRNSTFVPSYRWITDLGTDEAETCLAGGPSGRPLSPHYLTDVRRWADGAYKRLSAAETTAPDS